MSIPDAAVSRYHCYVEIRDGRPWVGDLASNGGLVVNGGVVRECPIDPQDVVTVGASSALHLLACPGDVVVFDSAKFFHVGSPKSGILLSDDPCGKLEEINDFIELMPASQESAPDLFGTADISEFGVPSALQEAENDVMALMSQDVAALKAGKMSREAVAERARQKANEYAGFSTKDAARRFLLYKGAFKLLVHAGPRLNDDAVDAWLKKIAKVQRCSDGLNFGGSPVYFPNGSYLTACGRCLPVRCKFHHSWCY